MATQTYDIWLIATQRAYKAVPYSVVADWLQQSRLTATDKVRLTGTTEWQEITASGFAAFLPRGEAQRVGDTAEALQPVEFDFGWRKRNDDEDDEVDMIPLIDVSLVLLVFFMLTTSAAAISLPIKVPTTQAAYDIAADPEVRIDMDWLNNEARCNIASGKNPAPDEDSNIPPADILSRLDERLQKATDALNIHIAAHRDMPYEVIQEFTTELEKRRRIGRGIASIRAEVNNQDAPPPTGATK